MTKHAIRQLAKFSWLAGICVWCVLDTLAWRQVNDAQTFAQAPHSSARLELVALMGALWSLSGGFWLAIHKSIPAA
jgi:hypothetical protein